MQLSLNLKHAREAENVFHECQHCVFCSVSFLAPSLQKGLSQPMRTGRQALVRPHAQTELSETGGETWCASLDYHGISITRRDGFVTCVHASRCRADGPLNSYPINRDGASRGKVVVVGAGPAGALSAIYLAKQSYDVEVKIFCSCTPRW